MSIKQAIEALEVAQDALDISQSLQESAKSNHHPKTLAAYERVSAALAALRSMPQGEPVATIRYERGTPGKENDMPKVVSCNWLPDGVYSVYATPHTEAVLSDAEERAAFELELRKQCFQKPTPEAHDLAWSMWKAKGSAHE